MSQNRERSGNLEHHNSTSYDDIRERLRPQLEEDERFADKDDFEIFQGGTPQIYEADGVVTAYHDYLKRKSIIHRFGGTVEENGIRTFFVRGKGWVAFPGVMIRK